MLFVLVLSARARSEVDCHNGPADDAQRNAASLTALPWSPFGRPEFGWQIYVPMVTREIGSACPAVSPGFALALSRWRVAQGLGAAGVIDPPAFMRLKQIWDARRPFVRTSRIACPPPPPFALLAMVRPGEAWRGKVVWLRASALTAYRAMVATARAQVPAIARDPEMLTIFSGYRDPDSDARRCAVEGNCQRIVRAACSSHRTGQAMDLFLGAAPGHRPDSSDDINRLFQSRTPAYQWLVANGGRFGFANYVFEPWHWEWSSDSQ